MKKISCWMLLAATLVFFAHTAFADDYDACKPIFEACAAQGYAKDETAPVGKKIWLNCASLILVQKKSVDKVDLDPKGWDAKNCRDYREAKAKFDAAWAANHKKP